MPTISAFIIAKNEEARIEEALRSLVSFCDEIILVDTGSTDRTKEIALNYTDKIYDYKWVNDFSAARNFALKQCTGDWIIYLDADDEIEPAMQNLIKETIQKASPDTLGFHVNYHYAKDKDLLTPRIFRSNLGLKFSMPVHEYLDLSEEQKSHFKVAPEIIILHHKNTADNKSTLQRNLNILKQALHKDPKNHHLNFFLAREKYNLGQYSEAQKILADLANNFPPAPALAPSSPADTTAHTGTSMHTAPPRAQSKTATPDQSFMYLVFIYLGLCYQKQNDGWMAIEAFREASQIYSHFAEPLIYEADTWLYLMNKADEAKELYTQALKIKKPQSGFPVNPDFYHEYPLNQLKKVGRLNMPTALVCGYYGIPNIGDELMLAAIIKSYPDHRIIVASYDTKTTQQIHNVEAVPHHHPYFDHALRQAKLVIIGGGTLFHDQGLEENTNVKYYCGIINSALTQGKNVIILGVGVDKISLEENQQLIKENFNQCSEIIVRDELSKTRLIKYGVTKFQIKVMEDLALRLKPADFLEPAGAPFAAPAATSQPNTKPLIGINLCPPIVEGSPTYQDKIDKELLPFITENIDKYNFIFIPGTEKDLQYVSYIKEKTGFDLPVFMPPINNNYLKSYFDLIHSCDRIIAARFHIILLAHLLNKPAEAVSYAQKTDELIKKYKISRFKNESRS